jgi:hypothetical protein
MYVLSSEGPAPNELSADAILPWRNRTGRSLQRGILPSAGTCSLTEAREHVPLQNLVLRRRYTETVTLTFPVLTLVAT